MQCISAVLDQWGNNFFTFLHSLSLKRTSTHKAPLCLPVANLEYCQLSVTLAVISLFQCRNNEQTAEILRGRCPTISSPFITATAYQS